jgi:hypothetical protein
MAYQKNKEKEYIITLGKNHLVRNNSSVRQDGMDEEWATNINALVGAYYSLYKTSEILPNINDNVTYTESCIQGSDLVDKIIKNNLNELENKNSIWFSGYYLNSAEIRISIAFEHFLKLHLLKNLRGILNLCDKLINCRCIHTCKNQKKDCKKILEGFYKKNDFSKFPQNLKANLDSKEIIRKEEITNPGESLRFVHGRVNDWKHEIKPEQVDLLHPKQRWWITCFALEELLISTNEMFIEDKPKKE